MKQQVEDRLRFYEEGVAPEKNIDVMKRTLTELGGSDLAEATPKTVLLSLSTFLIPYLLYLSALISRAASF
jgi:hypothetical protein